MAELLVKLLQYIFCPRRNSGVGTYEDQLDAQLNLPTPEKKVRGPRRTKGSPNGTSKSRV